MWQKARQVRASDVAQLDGATLWVECAPPKMKPAGSYYCPYTKRQFSANTPSGPWYRTNIRDGRRPVAVIASVIELLPEFAEVIDTITWQEFVNG